MNTWKKAITFSYDDGVTQDRRLVALFNKYGIKATFNLNSELLGRDGHLVREGMRISHVKVDPSEVRELYAGHEIAVHTLTHPNLAEVTDDEEIVRQVERDRENLTITPPCQARRGICFLIFPYGKPLSQISNLKYRFAL